VWWHTKGERDAGLPHDPLSTLSRHGMLLRLKPGVGKYRYEENVDEKKVLPGLQQKGAFLRETIPSSAWKPAAGKRRRTQP